MNLKKNQIYNIRPISTSTRWFVCVFFSEAGGILSAAAADEEQTFQPGRARHDFHLHRFLEYGLDTKTHLVTPPSEEFGVFFHSTDTFFCVFVFRLSTCA